MKHGLSTNALYALFSKFAKIYILEFKQYKDITLFNT